jgi:hypothetical protein
MEYMTNISGWIFLTSSQEIVAVPRHQLSFPLLFGFDLRMSDVRPIVSIHHHKLDIC